jgi:multiple sugar transport system ATP-binding protein
MAEIALASVTKIFPDGTKAVDAVDLQIPDGKLIVLVGPSGCGKTTILRMVAGLEEVTQGEILIGSRIVNDVPPGQRDLAMVFQNYALYPHMTVYQNIGLSLKIKKVKRDEIDRRVRHTARILHLEDILKKRPRELSGGQRQRVAMGRAIIREPQAFLMDEPLSNLDAKLRVQMRAEILGIQQQLQVTTIYVTHDQTEAMTLGDLVAVMRNGRVQQVASPHEVYAHPTNLFVAGFIGSPAMNMVRATIARRDGAMSVKFGANELRVPDEVSSAHPGLARYDRKEIVLGIRPEDMEDAAIVGKTEAETTFPIVVQFAEAMGSDVYLHFFVDAPPVVTEETRELASELGEDVLKGLEERASEQRTSFVARVSPETTAAKGDSRTIFVDTRKLYFFDPDSGQSISDGQAATTSYSVAAPAAR